MQRNLADLRALRFVGDYQRDHGVAPSVRELARMQGTCRRAGGERYMRLRQLGLVARLGTKSRAVLLTEIGMNTLMQLAGMATAGELIVSSQCPGCGATHFFGFGKPCGRCAPRAVPAPHWTRIGLCDVPDRVRDLFPVGLRGAWTALGWYAVQNAADCLWYAVCPDGSTLMRASQTGGLRRRGFAKVARCLAAIDRAARRSA